jgi:hypothetical protein
MESLKQNPTLQKERQENPAPKEQTADGVLSVKPRKKRLRARSGW